VVQFIYVEKRSLATQRYHLVAIAHAVNVRSRIPGYIGRSAALLEQTITYNKLMKSLKIRLLLHACHL
jgi:hypothetical protein